MYQRNKKPYGGLETVRINVGLVLGEEKDEDAYIVLKEPGFKITLAMEQAGEAEAANVFLNALGDLIADHNLMETETEKMTNEAVAELIKAKTVLGVRMLKEYTNGLFRFLPRQKGGK